MNKYLVPSLLAANFYNLENDLKVLMDNGIKIIHLDVMDGMFVPNLSFGIPVIESIKKGVADNLILDTHLMIEKPERYIEKFKKIGSDILTIHIEATDDAVKVLNDIKKLGMKAGICVNPETDIHTIDKCLVVADLILVMSVHPGFGGQKFIDDTLLKVKYLNEVRQEKAYNYIIEIDGGIGKDNIKEVMDAGVDYAVAGSAVFSGNIADNVKYFNSVIGDMR